MAKFYKKIIGFILLTAIIFNINLIGYCQTGISNSRNIRINGSVTDNIASSSEKDYYNFELDEDGYISIDFKHENFTKNEKSWSIILYDDNSNEIYSFDSYQNKPKTSSCNIGLPKGLYYILVKRTDYYEHHNGDYTLILNFEDSDDWETEKNETFKDADKIVTNLFYNGTIRNNNDKDYYKFTLNKDGVISIRFEHENFTYDEKSWEIILYDDSSNNIYAFNSRQNQIKASSCNIGLPQGNYFVYIHRTDYNDLHQGVYKFKIEYSTEINWEKEFNNTIKDATKITSMGEYYGSIKTSDDKDYYRVDISKSGDYVIDFIHENLTDDEKSWKIILYNDTSKELGRIESAQNQVKTSFGTKHLDVGTYYILVARKDYSDLSDADYTISFTKANQKTTQNNNSLKIGDVINFARYTDIVAKINGYEIASFNVDDYTYVIAEDLREYGFDVEWVGSSRKLYITKNKYAGTVSSSYTKPYIPSNLYGKKSYDILYTDIRTYVDGKYVESFNINGQTLIQFDELAEYGTVEWSQKKRTISLDM